MIATNETNLLTHINSSNTSIANFNFPSDKAELTKRKKAGNAPPNHGFTNGKLSSRAFESNNGNQLIVANIEVTLITR